MPKPAHLTWEEAACNALCNSTSYRMIVSPNGSQMTQGQAVLVWGATGGIGAYAIAVRLQRRRHAGRRRVVGEARRAAPRAGLRRGDRPPRRGLQVLERRRHRAGPDGVAAVRQEDPRAHRPRRRHRVRAPGSFDDGCVGVRRQARRDDHHVRGDVGVQDRVRQPLPLDEPQDVEGLPLRELPRGVGGEPARVRRAHPPDAVEGVPARRDRRGRVPGAPQPRRGQGRRAVPRARGGSRRHRRSDARRSTSIRSRCSADTRVEFMRLRPSALYRPCDGRRPSGPRDLRLAPSIVTAAPSARNGSRGTWKRTRP